MQVAITPVGEGLATRPRRPCLAPGANIPGLLVPAASDTLRLGVERSRVRLPRADTPLVRLLLLIEPPPESPRLRRASTQLRPPLVRPLHHNESPSCPRLPPLLPPAPKLFLPTPAVRPPPSSVNPGLSTAPAPSSPLFTPLCLLPSSPHRLGRHLEPRSPRRACARQ